MSATNTICIGGVSLTIGQGASALVGQELAKNGLKKPLIVTDAVLLRLGICSDVFRSLDAAQIPYAVFDSVPSDPPASAVTRGTEICRQSCCDAVVAIGGGSVLDCAKAIKMMVTHGGNSILSYKKGGLIFTNPGLPLFSIPTTSGTGSEVTQYAVITDEEKQVKTTIGHPYLVSKAVYLDPCLTAGLPPRITAATAMDALGHAIEAYTSNRVLYAGGSTAFSDVLDLEAIRLIAHALPSAVSDGRNLQARTDVMVGAAMAGLVSQAGSGSAHGIGAALGAMYHVPHGEAVGMLLPYVMEHNLPVCIGRFANIAKALGADINGVEDMDAAKAGVAFMKQLVTDIRLPVLRDYVKDEAELPALAEKGLIDHCNSLNSAPLTNYELCLKILERAWHMQ